MLIVEQDVNQALAVADRFYCLLEGRVSLAGTPAEVTKEQITDGYFGIDIAFDDTALDESKESA